MGHSVADLAAEWARLEPEFAKLKERAAPLDQFYLSTRYPNSLPGGVPAEAFTARDAERALEMAREVIAVVKRRFQCLTGAAGDRVGGILRSTIGKGRRRGGAGGARSWAGAHR